MNYNDYTFGLEIEFRGANTQVVTDTLNAALNTNGINFQLQGYNHTTPRGFWKITTDATVSRNYSFRTGVGEGGELVSPPLTGLTGLDEVKRVLEVLNTIEALYIDRRCGIHVHLSWGNMEVETIKNVVRRYAQYENEIDGWMPRSRRGNNSNWCASTVGRFSSTLASYDGDSLTALASRSLDRFYKVNVKPLQTYGTIEFRQHSGSTDYDKISNWIKFLMAFVEASKSATQGATTNYKRKKRIAFGEIREQVASKGWDLRFAGNAYKLFDLNGNFVETLTMEQLVGFYEDCPQAWNKSYAPTNLNQNFIDWFTRHFGDDIDTLFQGVDSDVQQFLIDRTQLLAS